MASDPAPAGDDPRDLVQGAIQAMAPITLDEMDCVKLLDRVDTKFTLKQQRLAELIEAIADEYRVLEVAGVRAAPYSTLYFDTPDRGCYRDHHNGRGRRRKYRMRSYGPAGPAFFEVKTKTNKGRTVKQRVPVSAIRPVLDADLEQLVSDAGGTAAGLGPHVWTRFTRFTLVGRGFEERVTIDADLSFSTPEGEPLGPLDLAIVEIKQPRRSQFSPVRSRLRAMRVGPARFSKYCVGSALLDPGLKRNRFKSTLRAVGSLSH